MEEIDLIFHGYGRLVGVGVNDGVGVVVVITVTALKSALVDDGEPVGVGVGVAEGVTVGEVVGVTVFVGVMLTTADVLALVNSVSLKTDPDMLKQAAPHKNSNRAFLNICIKRVDVQYRHGASDKSTPKERICRLEV